MGDISVTPANVRKSTGQTLPGVAGAALTAGQYVYADTSTSPPTINLSDANGGSAGSAARNVSGVTLNNAATGQPVDYTALDPKLVSGGTLTAGTVVYLSQTPGGITATIGDLASGSTVIALGVVNTDLTLNFSPVKGGEVP